MPKQSRPRARDKRTPHYTLKEIKTLLKQGKHSLTTTTIQGGHKLGFSRTEIINCVLNNIEITDFYKSMTHYMNYKLWQDAYKPYVNDTQLYVKLQIFDGKVIVVDFKEA